MSFAVLALVPALVAIFLGAEAFTNALEHLGQCLKISEGVTGSIFAAIATAMPETLVPVIALLGVSAVEQVRIEVAMGAILGAPLMLSTVALFLLGLVAARKRGWRAPLHPERTGLRRNLSWFLLMFGIATLAMFVPSEAAPIRGAVVLGLVLMYLLYLLLTIRASARLVREGHGTEADHPLYLTSLGQRLGLRALPENVVTMLAQLAPGFALIVVGARGFVHGVETLSELIGVSALVLSLLIIPVATELPEMANSTLWVRRRRDTLAFGNITGAMAFQASMLPALGLALTPWDPRPEVVIGAVLTLSASAYLLVMLRRTELRPRHLLPHGLCYALYYLYVLIGL